MGGVRPSVWVTHADGPLAEKNTDAVLSILGVLSPRMGPLRLGMNPIRLRAQPGMEVFVFHWGCTRRVDDHGEFDRLCTQRNRTLSRGYVLGNSRAVLLLALGRFVPPVMKSSGMQIP